MIIQFRWWWGSGCSFGAEARTNVLERAVGFSFFQCHSTVSIRNVSDFEVLTYQIALSQMCD